MKKFLKFIIYFFLSPILFLMLVLRPLKSIKLCQIHSNRIGPFIFEMEGFLSVRNNKPEIKNSLIFFYFSKYISNEQLKIMVKRILPIYSYNIILNMLRQTILFWGVQKHHNLNMSHFHLNNIYSMSPKWFECKNSHLYFSSEEKKRGLELIKRLNMKEDDKWICIHNRDFAYLDKTYLNQAPPSHEGSWSYHNYRDFPVNSLVVAAEFFANKGYYVLRMGSVVKEKFITKNSKIIDYANNKLRDDFSDIYLLSHCKAYFGSDSGISSVSFAFKKPVYFVNFSSTLIHNLTSYYASLFIFKRIKNLENGKLLTLREILKSNFAYTAISDDFKKSNVLSVDNSKEDLKSFAIETDNDLNGHLSYDDEDLKIQKEFWNIYLRFADKKKIGNFQPRISPSFLRKNLDLLN